MTMMAWRLHYHQITLCRPHCRQLQTRSSFAKTTILKVPSASSDQRTIKWITQSFLMYSVCISCCRFLTASKPQPSVATQDEYLISPITGEKIPASKMQEHMRIGLLDPRWLEQRDRSIRDRQTEDEVYAPGLDIESSLKQLAERRTDIFGVEETAIGKKIGEEEIQKPEEKVSKFLAFTVWGLRKFGAEWLRAPRGDSDLNIFRTFRVARLLGTATQAAWLVPSRRRRPTSPCRSR